MSASKAGDTVRIHYTGTLEDGTTFDSSNGREPLEFEIGAGQIITGLDKAMTGLKVGDTKTVTVPADEGYGPINPDARQAIPRDSVPDHIPLEPGTQLQMQDPEGRVIPVVVVEANEDAVVLDANHPLAGKDLTFEVELVEIV